MSKITITRTEVIEIMGAGAAREFFGADTGFGIKTQEDKLLPEDFVIPQGCDGCCIEGRSCPLRRSCTYVAVIL